jgi:hypothetical protein
VNWTWTNTVFIVVGSAMIVSGALLLRHRVKARDFILAQQENLLGPRVGQYMERKTTPMSGVGVPAIFDIVLGVIIVMLAIFGHLQ